MDKVKVAKGKVYINGEYVCEIIRTPAGWCGPNLRPQPTARKAGEAIAIYLRWFREDREVRPVSVR